MNNNPSNSHSNNRCKRLPLNRHSHQYRHLHPNRHLVPEQIPAPEQTQPPVQTPTPVPTPAPDVYVDPSGYAEGYVDPTGKVLQKGGMVDEDGYVINIGNEFCPGLTYMGIESTESLDAWLLAHPD